jgi:hypothetical protein
MSMKIIIHIQQQMSLNSNELIFFKLGGCEKLKLQRKYGSRALKTMTACSDPDQSVF